jgi:hypothetical protein
VNSNKFQVIRSVEGVPKESDFSQNFRHLSYLSPMVLDRSSLQLYAKNLNGEIKKISSTVVVEGQPGPQGLDGNISKCWPVGSVFLCTKDTSPDQLLGFGKWELIKKPTGNVSAYYWERIK